jgi:acyl carrier protein
MDLLAQNDAQQGFPILSVNWDGWELSQKPSTNMQGANLLMNAELGSRAIAEILKFAMPGQIIVSREPFQPRVAQWLYRRTPKASIQAPPIAPAPQNAKKHIKAPQNPVQEQLLAIWSAILGKEPLSIDDSFFDMGGHSLMGTQVLSRVRDHFGLDLPVKYLYEHPTVAQFASWLETQNQTASTSQAPTIEKAAARVEEADPATLLAELEGLSEAELEELLS